VTPAELAAELVTLKRKLDKVLGEVERSRERRETFAAVWSITPVFIPKVSR